VPRAASTSEPAAPDATDASSGVALGALLSDPALRADKRSAFASLYRLWGIQFDATSGSLGCERARAEGLECLFRAGTWAKLRRYDLPAMIELPGGTGDPRFATVVALDERTATLDFAGRRHRFRLEEVDLYWDGAFMLLWKPSSVSATPIKLGARGKEVEWVRQRLAEADGGPTTTRNRDLFDDELRARVIAFQRARSLQADGVVGEETVSQLMASRRDSRVPRLWRAGS
jgi:general secretion pathway protein A